MIDVIAVGGSDTASPLNVAKRIALIKKWVDLPNARLLDAGCGAGEYVEALTLAGADAQGVEFVEAKVQQWLERRPADGRVKRGDIENLAFKNATFDAVLLNEVLEHVPDDRKALSEIHRVLRPGGVLLLFSPNRFHPFETHGVYSIKTGAHRGMARTFMLPWLPVSMAKRYFRFWARNYWPDELASLIEMRGFRIKHHTYVWQTFENNSGEQSGVVRRFAPIMRVVAKCFERTPALRRLGVSQLVIAERA